MTEYDCHRLCDVEVSGRHARGCVRREEREELHGIARYFMLGKTHHLQCTCGERYSDVTERAVMQKHFRHGTHEMNRHPSGGAR